MGYGLYIWSDDGTPRVFEGSHLLRWYDRYQFTIKNNESRNIYIPEFNITTWAVIVERCPGGASISTYPGRIKIIMSDNNQYQGGNVSIVILKGDGV